MMRSMLCPLPRSLPTPRLRGFTLIELMVVIAIMAILALIAVPTYLDKIVREQIIEALPLADIATRPVTSMWNATKDWASDNAAAELPKPDLIVGTHVSAVTIDDGVVHITFGNRANGMLKGKVLSLRPAIVEDAPIVPITWVCGNASAPDKMTLIGKNLTNIDPNYLPMRCR